MSVTPITKKFDQDVDTVLHWMHEPETAPMPMVVLHAARQAETETLPALGAVLPGPATELDAMPLPVVKVRDPWSICWGFLGGLAVGAAYMGLLLWLI